MDILQSYNELLISFLISSSLNVVRRPSLNPLASCRPFNLRILTIDVLLRPSLADGVRVSNDNKRRIGTVISIDIFEASICCDTEVLISE